MNDIEKKKLSVLVEKSGFDSVDELLVNRGIDASVPAICMNPGCDHTEDMEPDQRRGWCPECETGSVKSCLVLLRLI